MRSLKEEMIRQARNAIRLDIKGKAPGGVGSTKFGGTPDVPAGFIWPVFETATFEDDEVKPRPLAFLAQFNCAQLSPLDQEGLLPKTGLLSFFYELGSQRWGYDPEDQGCARVFWVQDTEGLSPASFPEDMEREYRLPEIGVAMRQEESYPDYEDLDHLLQSSDSEVKLDLEEFEAAQAELGMDGEDDNCSKLLGWADTIQGNITVECELVSRGYYLGGNRDLPPEEVRAQAARTSIEDWQLLFQLDTVKRGRFELMFGDCGRIYFYIRKEDLRAGQFDRVWLSQQCC